MLSRLSGLASTVLQELSGDYGDAVTESSISVQAVEPEAGSMEGAPEQLLERLAQTEKLVVQLKDLIREKDTLIQQKETVLKEEREAADAKLMKLKLQAKAKLASLNKRIVELTEKGSPMPAQTLPDEQVCPKGGRNIEGWLWMLSTSRITTHGDGDCKVAQSKPGTIETDFEAWKAKFLSQLHALCRGERKPCSGKCKKGKCRSPGKQSKESSDHEHGASEYENIKGKPSSVGPYFWFSAPRSTV